LLRRLRILATVTANERLFSHHTFDELDLVEEVRAGVREAGFTYLTLVQAETLPLTLAGRDAAVQAQTGTGKTAAYVLTIFNRLLRHPRDTGGRPRALVVAPTRELVLQVVHDAETLGRHTALRVLAVFGGMEYREQRSRLAAGTDLIAATPGRLLDYLRDGAVHLGSVEVLVVDEADRMFDMGFVDDLRDIIRRLPPAGRRQTMFYTATLSTRVAELGWREMDNPAEIVVNPEELTPDRLEQELFHVGGREKFSLLLGLLTREGHERTMIFVNTREEARRLAERLERHGLLARALTGSLLQRRRLKVLDEFKTGALPILVATDVASRGLHIEGVSHVINYDLPLDPEDYVHRVGRTARVGAKGKAISLACENFVYALPAIERFLGTTIPVSWADDSLFRKVTPRPRPPAEAARASSRPRRRRRRRDAPGEAPPKAHAEPS
jgi:ATP-dependent RNA helicase RhlB